MEEQISTNEVMDLLINEGNVTTLAIEQDSEGNIIAVDKTPLQQQEEEEVQEEVKEEKPNQRNIEASEISSENIKKLGWEFAKGVKSSDVKTTKVFSNCFVGKTAVDWIQQNVCKMFSNELKKTDQEVVCSREVATQLGDKLFEEGYIWICDGQKNKDKFQDDSTVYRHISVFLIDDNPPSELIQYISTKVKGDSGIILREEKGMLGKHKNVFTEDDLSKWLVKNVANFQESDLPKAIKVLIKKGVIEKVSLTSFLQFPKK